MPFSSETSAQYLTWTPFIVEGFWVSCDPFFCESILPVAIWCQQERTVFVSYFVCFIVEFLSLTGMSPHSPARKTVFQPLHRDRDMCHFEQGPLTVRLIIGVLAQVLIYENQGVVSRWPARSRAGEAHSREVSLAAGCQGSLVFPKLDVPLKTYLTRRCRQSVGTCASFVLDIRSVTFSTVHLCHVLLCHFCTCVHFRMALESQAKRCLLICYHIGLIDCPLRTSFTRRKNKPRHDTVLNGVEGHLRDTSELRCSGKCKSLGEAC